MLLDKGIAVVILAVNLADSLSLADRLIRILKDKPMRSNTRGEFSAMPISAPWIELYREAHERLLRYLNAGESQDYEICIEVLDDPGTIAVYISCCKEKCLEL